jgi:hypothetical protein
MIHISGVVPLSPEARCYYETQIGVVLRLLDGCELREVAEKNHVSGKLTSVAKEAAEKVVTPLQTKYARAKALSFYWAFTAG